MVTAPGSGAEIIPFLKTWVNLPSAIAFTILFAKMSSVLSAEACFYIIMTTFLVFFLGFAFVVYPNVQALHPHGMMETSGEEGTRGVYVYTETCFVAHVDALACMCVDQLHHAHLHVSHKNHTHTHTQHKAHTQHWQTASSAQPPVQPSPLPSYATGHLLCFTYLQSCGDLS